MEAIDQLKTLRDEALLRLQRNPDYKLLTSLDALIVDLENVTKTERPKFMIVDDESAHSDEASAADIDGTVEEAFEKITAEIESDSNASSESNEADAKPFVSFS